MVSHYHAAVELNASYLSRLLRRRLLADWLAVGFGVFAFSWIPAALILIIKDADLHPVFRTFYQLWPLSVIPLLGFVISLLWRSSLKRKIIEVESRHDV